MSTFSDQIKAFAEKTNVKLDKIQRKIVIDITRELMLMTPVDTGHARSNWFWGTNRVIAIDPAKNKNGGPSMARATAFSLGIQGGGVYYITNNLPYIMALEFGSSKQAPAGMARVTVARWQKIVNAAVGGIQ